MALQQAAEPHGGEPEPVSRHMAVHHEGLEAGLRGNRLHVARRLRSGVSFAGLRFEQLDLSHGSPPVVLLDGRISQCTVVLVAKGQFIG